jgi:outer membrane protein assembly factor BamB
LFISLSATAVADDWPQWGGRERNFTARAKLAESWPETGLRQLWRRPLGDAYSSIVAAHGRLYVMSRHEGQEHVVALKAATGETIWDQEAPAAFLDGTNVEENGPGPLATPLVVGDRLITVGITADVRCFDCDDGSVIWRHELATEFGGTRLYRGYSASPVAFEETVILPVGGSKQAVVAFRISDGSVAWRKHDFDISHVSPLLIRVAGQTQLVVLGSQIIVGLDPATGALLWQHAHPMAGGHVASTPIWHDGRLFFSGAYGAGSWCLRLKQEGDRTVVSELWHNVRMRVHHSNVIRIGDFVYASSGDFSAIPFTALNLNSGKVVWQDRRITRASCLLVDERLIVLQEDGRLMLASVSPDKLTIHSKVQLFDERAWTPPTLVGNTLYIRNRREVLAFQLP